MESSLQGSVNSSQSHIDQLESSVRSQQKDLRLFSQETVKDVAKRKAHSDIKRLEILNTQVGEL